ncbi:hypothetical protein [Okeania sp. SIO2C2]|uniref:hypothetical protein n=1 Tax=Okeania sp. SIO2C2 TaxID=2607787 RepID=UPI00257F7181|nr:hypothetical protein [Okeania sp. SIO2C2]
MSPQESGVNPPLAPPRRGSQESGGNIGEKEEILEKSKDNFSIYLIPSVLSVLKFYL